MIATSLLTLTAVVLSIEGAVATLDKGRTDGLRPGDAGQVYYTLAVGPDKRPARIDVGQFQVLAVEDSTATLEVPSSSVRVGFSVEFRIPRDRFERIRELRRAVELERPEREPESGPEKEPEATADEGIGAPRMILVPGGTYSVGAELAEARFYNQFPRFQVVLESFWIDPSPVTRAEFLELDPEFSLPAEGVGGFATGVSYRDAEEHCRRRGQRIPTELEWESAVKTPGLANRFPLYEWTSSWYQPYPGNTFPEEQYGEEYRVLRGSPEPGETDPRLRSYLNPESRRPDVGFRCARNKTSDEI